MKRIGSSAVGAALGLSLLWASSASAAATWDPQGTAFAVTQEGHGTFTGTGGSNVTCSGASMTLRAADAVATTSTTTNPVSFVGCVFGNAAVTVTTFGDWNFTSTSTTTVNLSATSGTGKVITVHVPSIGCEFWVDSPLIINNNTWNNTTHTLSINGGSAFPITGSGLCSAAFGNFARLDSNFVAPDATIT